MGLNVDALAAKIAKGQTLSPMEQLEYDNNKALVDAQIQNYFSSAKTNVVDGYSNMGLELTGNTKVPGGTEQTPGTKGGITINIDASTRVVVDVIIKTQIDQIISQLLDAINNLSGKMDEIIAVINGNQANLIYFLQQLFHQYLGTLGSDMSDIRELLTQILSQVEINGGHVGNIEELMQQLLELELNTQGAVLGLTSEVTTLIELVAHSNATQEQQTALLADILALLQAIKADTSENNQLSRDILAAINNLGVGAAASLAAILNAINAGNAQNAEGIDDLKALVQTLINAVNNNTLNDNANTQAILDAIAGIQIGPNGQIDLSSLEAMMAQLLQLVANGNNTLNSIDGKLDLVNLTVNAIQNLLEELLDDQTIPQDYSAVLQQILAAIGELGTGETQDYTAILTEILNAINDNVPPDYSAQFAALLTAINNIQPGTEYDDSQVLAMLQAILDAILQCCNTCQNGNNEGVNELVIELTSTGSGSKSATQQVHFPRTGQGLAAGIVCILSHDYPVVGNTTNGDDNNGNVNIDDVEQPKPVEVGATVKISKALRPELEVVFNKLGIRDEQVYITKFVGNDQVQVFDMMGRPRGNVKLTEQELNQMFRP